MSAPAEDDRIMRPDVMCLRQLSLLICREAIVSMDMMTA
ncbi:Hypothetical protein RY67_794 [Bifidobacterium longum subsp. infantis]|uniref:Uncharacterized protein n=1 Tax=Bifidobacterium longum subsp. infantis TaxID=1682 RepID=A0A0M4M2B2_BIFLI|nr:Hypothetical protein RY67_794 [Bifidobacterium longum subsp. infantis]